MSIGKRVMGRIGERIMNRESNLEEEVKERGVVLVGFGGEDLERDTLHRKLMDIIDNAKDYDAHAVYFAPGGHPTQALEYAVMRVAEGHRIVLVADFAHELNVKKLKLPEVRKVDIADLRVREGPKYLFEDNLDKNFNNKGYLSKIKGSQINYKARR